MTAQSNNSFSTQSDHGSYKVTSCELNLSSPNMDNNLPSPMHSDNIVTPNCNLPDVLPVGVKFSHQPANDYHHPSDHLNCSQTAPVISNPSKNVFHFQSISNPSVQPNFSTKSVFELSTVSASQIYDKPESDINLYESPLNSQIYDKTESDINLYESPLNSQNIECDKIATVRKITMVEDSTPMKQESNSVQINKLIENSLVMEISDKSINNEIDESKLTQRTELILRVQPSTQEVETQTEIVEDRTESKTPTIEEQKDDFWNPLTRKKYQEEYDCEKLSKDLLAHLLSPNDKLHEILGEFLHSKKLINENFNFIKTLAPKIYKTSSDYISDLFKVSLTFLPAAHEKFVSKWLVQIHVKDVHYLKI